jgi:genome maintenance exonuclease 1
MQFNHISVQQIADITSKDTSRGRFYTTPSGSVYPSITTVLGHIEKPAIAEWRLSLGAVKADKETKRAADRGTAVHTMIERYLNNEEDPTVGFDHLNIREFKQLRTKLNKVDDILCQEYPLFSDTLKLAGRVDCIGHYDGELAIIDFKTSNGNKTEGMIHDYYMQTAGYAVMFQELYNIQIDKIVILMSVEKGAVPLVFKQDVDPWISPLCERINSYYKSTKA